MKSLYAIILAAGRGERMGAGINKALLPLAGKPVLSYALEMWQPLADKILLVAQPADWPAMQPLLTPYGEQAALVAGGNSRAASLGQALAALPPRANSANELIAVHDAARPLTAITDIERTIAAAKHHGAAILATPLTDTIRFRENTKSDIREQAEGLCGSVVPREQLIAAQTPQIFRRDLLVGAYEQADEKQLANITDDAALLQVYGYSCAYVLAEHVNIKLTTPQDLEIICALVSGTTRTGWQQAESLS